METLKIYLKKTNQKPAAFARRCEINKGNLSKNLNLKKKPTTNTMIKVFRETGGMVTPNDMLKPWLAQPEPKEGVMAPEQKSKSKH